MVQITRRAFCNLASELRCDRTGVIEGRKIRQLSGLIGHGISDFIAAISNLNAPHASRPVDQPLADIIGDINTIAGLDKGAIVLAKVIHPFPRVHEMIVVPDFRVCIVHSTLSG